MGPPELTTLDLVIRNLKKLRSLKIAMGIPLDPEAANALAAAIRAASMPVPVPPPPTKRPTLIGTSMLPDRPLHRTLAEAEDLTLTCARLRSRCHILSLLLSGVLGTLLGVLFRFFL